jgi:hypothetical protein
MEQPKNKITELIKKYESLLEEHSKYLLEELTPKVESKAAIISRWNIQDRINAQRQFIEDPYRKFIISQIAMLTSLESPKIIIKREQWNNQNPNE